MSLGVTGFSRVLFSHCDGSDSAGSARGGSGVSVGTDGLFCGACGADGGATEGGSGNAGCDSAGSGWRGWGVEGVSFTGESPPGSGGKTFVSASRVSGRFCSSDLSKIASGSRMEGVFEGPIDSGFGGSNDGAGLFEVVPGGLKSSPGSGGRSSSRLGGEAGGPSSVGKGGSISEPDELGWTFSVVFELGVSDVPFVSVSSG